MWFLFSAQILKPLQHLLARSTFPPASGLGNAQALASGKAGLSPESGAGGWVLLSVSLVFPCCSLLWVPTKHVEPLLEVLNFWKLRDALVSGHRAGCFTLGQRERFENVKFRPTDSVKS